MHDGSEDHTNTRLAADSPGLDLDAALAAMAHSLLNTLHTITTASDLAQMLIARDKAADAAGALTRIESECMRAACLLREGREFMTLPANPVQGAVDLTTLLRACADAAKGEVQVDAARTLPTLIGNAGALRRSFMEILDNAFQFGASRVRVMVEHVAAERCVSISFHDDGAGIAVPAASLFEPFFSTDREEHSGLGLALAARLVKVHGGSIDVDAAVAQGSTVRVKLPAPEA